MSIHLQLNVPSSGWEYIPLPNLTTTGESSSPDYELILHFPLPDFVAKLFGLTRRGQDQPEPALIGETRQLIQGGSFTLCEEGVGGTYFVRMDNQEILSVFKPEDEEAGAPNNPKGLVKKPLLPPGGGAIREVAAFLLDRGFAGVPETHYITNVRHNKFNGDQVKQGSLQRFVPNDGVSSDMGSKIFNTEDIHRIGILDIRLFNLDRNGENLLVVKRPTDSTGTSSGSSQSAYSLIPIDHSYCLPSICSLEGAYFEWQYWAQAKQPFSPATLSFIQSIDIEHDAQILRSLGIAEECIGTMVVCTLLLKKAAEYNKTLFDVAALMTRKDLKLPSPLENLIKSSEETAKITKRPFLDVFQGLLPDLLA